MTPTRLSPTRIATYLKCPASYRYRYESGLPETLNPWMIRGIAVHAAVEAFYRGKLQNRPLSADQVAKIAERAFNEELRRFPLEEQKRFDNLLGLRLDAKTMARCYCRDLGARIVPVCVEQDVEKALPSGVTVVGRVDLVEERGVRDLKTASRPPCGSEAVESLQLPAYAWMMGISLPVMGYLDFTTTTTVFPVPAEITERSVEAFVTRAERVAQGIANRDFPATPDNPGACLRCQFAQECIPQAGISLKRSVSTPYI